MVALPSPTVDAIYTAYERNHTPWIRQTIGASDIGKQCDRRLWLGFRHVAQEKHEGRVLRLFQTGHREEDRIVADLRAAGFDVWSKDPSTGKQFEYIGLDGHLVCHLDGVVLGLPEAPETPHLLECKTSNKKNFDKLEKEGVEKAKPEHFAQMQLCMGLADLTRAAYIVACKDDERIYFERIHFDDKVFKALLLRANRIIKAETPPDRISNDPAYYVCKFCPFAAQCHGAGMPAASCRTCVHASPAPNGTWSCANDLNMQPGCGEHVYIPDLLHWAEPIDGDPTWVKYRVKSTGREFINCADTGFPADDVPHYASRELANCTPAAIGDPRVEAARTILDGEVAESRQLEPQP
jgi:hypothetical protein